MAKRTVPSELLREAATSLKKVTADKRYAYNAAVLHAPNRGRCEVSLAGAWLAKTHKVDITRDLEPLDFTLPIRRKMQALHCAEVGAFGKMFFYLLLPFSAGLDFIWPRMPRSPIALVAALRKVAAEMKRKGY